MDGYKQNSQGALVPIEKISEVDLLRDELVLELSGEAKRLQDQLASFKRKALDSVSAFVDLSAEKYQHKYGGNKGNLSLRSFDGNYRVQVAISDRIVFDERLQIAKSLIDSCINRWSDGVDRNLKAIVNDAFQVDKEGRINTTRVLGLRRLDITDHEWQQAMKAISESIVIDSTKEYLRFYCKDERGNEIKIPVDLASV